LTTLPDGFDLKLFTSIPRCLLISGTGNYHYQVENNLQAQMLSKNMKKLQKINQ